MKAALEGQRAECRQRVSLMQQDIEQEQALRAEDQARHDAELSRAREALKTMAGANEREAAANEEVERLKFAVAELEKAVVRLTPSGAAAAAATGNGLSW